MYAILPSVCYNFLIQKGGGVSRSWQNDVDFQDRGR